MKLTYSEQLKHPNWQRKRLEMLEAAGWECTNCGDKDSTLHAHHRRYVKGRMAWEYDAPDLAVLCEACHMAEHDSDDELREFMAHVGNPSEVLALAYGYFAGTAAEAAGVHGHSAKALNPYTWACGFIGFLCSTLSGPQLLQVADFASSLSRPGLGLGRTWEGSYAREEMERIP